MFASINPTTAMNVCLNMLEKLRIGANFISTHFNRRNVCAGQNTAETLAKK
jgi:hypothetical protein